MRNVSLVVFVVLAFPLAAQQMIEEHAAVPTSSPECSLGVKYDNTINQGFFFTNPGNRNGVAMKFNFGAGITGLQQVCGCFSRSPSGTVTSTSFDVEVYDDDGPSGKPGTLLKTVTSRVSDIPLFPSYKFATASLLGSGLVLPDSNVYLAIRWPTGIGIYHCYDSSSTTTQRTVYSTQSETWNLPSLSNPPKAWGIRTDPTGLCVPSATAMCLNGGRFKVEATWQTASASGNASAVKLTDDSGYFWFFSSTNIEAVVKVLNACGLNSAYWVFAGGLTDVNVALKVTDIKSGTVKIYTNPQGRPFQPIQDVNAFVGSEICP